MIVLTLLLQVASAAQQQTLVLEHLELDAPPGYSLEKRRGPDFAVYYLRSPSNACGLGVYFGNHPTRDAVPSGSVRREPLRLGRRKANWSIWETQEAGVRTLHAAVVAEKPFGNEPPYSTHLHVFIDADSEATLKQAQAIAATLRPTPSKTKPGSGASVLPNKCS
jgi:hypothetical protein